MLPACAWGRCLSPGLLACLLGVTAGTPSGTCFLPRTSQACEYRTLACGGARPGQKLVRVFRRNCYRSPGHWGDLVADVISDFWGFLPS